MPDDDNLTFQGSGQIVSEAAEARDEMAYSQQPPVGQEYLDDEDNVVERTNTSQTNAEEYDPEANTDVGTDDELRSVNDTQSIPPPTSRSPLPNVAGATGGPVPGITPGVGAPGDDQTRNGGPTGTVNATKNTVNNLFSGANGRIQPQPNILDNYASYTYNVSIYLMSPSDYKQLMRTKKKSISGYQLLMASGGAPTGAGVSPATYETNVNYATEQQLSSYQRNQFFPLDYYLDDIKLKSICPGKGSQGAHNVFEMSFKIFEPNGITLLDNLYAATQQYVGANTGTGKQNYAAQNYLMVVRFYGYDENGNLVAPKNVGSDGQTDSKSIVEKFIPFQFTAVKFKIANRVTEYDCTAVCPQNVIASGQARGVIPYNIELTSTTLKNLLTGNITYSTNQSNAGLSEGREANQTAATAARTGVNLANGSAGGGRGSANDPRRLDAPSNNSVPFSEVDIMGNQTGIPSVAEDSQTVDGPVPTTVAGNSPTQNAAPAKVSAAPNPSIVAGLANALNKFQQEKVADGTFTYPDEYEIVIVEPALQNASVRPPGQTDLKVTPMIEANSAAQALLSSKQSVNNRGKNTSAVAGTSVVQFIDQVARTSTFIYDQQTSIIDPNTGDIIPQGIPGDIFSWYRIGMQAEPKIGQYDEKRNDYAYKITYQLSAYKVNNMKSDYFPQSRFQGTHKKYNHWFTGENTSILNFEQDYNYLYYIVVNKNPPTKSGTTNWREYEKRAFQPRSNQSDQGIDGAVNEPSANAADYLYSPADQSRVKLTIVGDPSWIQQGEIWSGVAGLKFQYGPFLSDGTINYESQEVLFEVAFNKPVDYNMATGIMDPGKNNYDANRNLGIAGDARQSYIYKAVDVTSTLSQGKFTQELNGVLVIYPTPTDNYTKQLQTTDASSTVSNILGVGRKGPTLAAALGLDPGNPISNLLRTPISVLGNPLGLQTGPGLNLGKSQNNNPTSNGQDVVVPNVDYNADTGGLFTQPTTTAVNLKAGGTQTVTTAPEVLALYNSGQINFTTASGAINKLQSQENAEQPPVTTNANQTISRDY
jgi:hypothetical protein